VFILKKIFFSRSSRPISIKLGTNHQLVKGIFSGQVLFKGEIITKMRTFGEIIEKLFP
jgi:hypothetical protein